MTENKVQSNLFVIDERKGIYVYREMAELGERGRDKESDM